MKIILLKRAGAWLFPAALILLSGCCPRRAVLSQSVADTLSVEREIKYIERLRDTVIYVKVPVEVKEEQTLRDSSFLETSLAKSSARIGEGGALFHTLENKPRREPVTVTVKETVQEKSASAGSVRVERVEVPVEAPLTWMQKTLMGCGAAFMAILSGAAAFAVIRIVVRRRK